MELTPAGTTILSVQASDIDDNENARLTFDLNHQQADSNFIINQRGNVTTANEIRFNKNKRNLQLLVSATDSGHPARSVLTTVFVQIRDRNNNSPKFTKRQYR